MKLIHTLTLMGLLVFPASYADQSSPKLDALFDTLLQIDTTPGQARIVTSEIWKQWLESEDEEARRLMDLGISRMNQLALKEAVEIFSELIDLKPNFAEAWNKRATVYYMMGQFDKSTADVVETLSLEPRHFGALSGQGLIYIQINRREAALDWFKRALAVNPFMENIQIGVEQLEQEIKGKII